MKAKTRCFSSLATGGVLPLLIIISPIRDALIDYHPSNVLTASLNKNFFGIKGFVLGKMETRQITDKTSVYSWVNQANGAPLLIVQLDYRFTLNFDRIITTATVSLHGGNKIDSAEANSKYTNYYWLPPVVYYNVFSSSDTLPSTGSGDLSRDQAAALWAKDNGQAAHAALDRELNELGAMITYDLTIPGPADGSRYKNENAEEQAVAMGISGIYIEYGSFVNTYTPKGYVERKVDGRAWVRLPTGELGSL